MYSWNFLKTFKRGRRTQPLVDVPQRDKADTTRARGMRAEDQALHLLMRAGLELLTRNYRTPGRGGGEIDLIMRERDGTVVFVEVRSRNRHDFGGAGASIGAIKQRRIILAARHYLATRRAEPPCRFDVVLLEPEPHWLKGAFDASAA